TLVSIGPECLLLEEARRVDEWSLIEKKIPSFDLVFEVDRAQCQANDAKLTKEQRVVLQLIDGVRDVHGILEESGLVEFSAAKASGRTPRRSSSARQRPSKPASPPGTISDTCSSVRDVLTKRSSPSMKPSIMGCTTQGSSCLEPSSRSGWATPRPPTTFSV